MSESVNLVRTGVFATESELNYAKAKLTSDHNAEELLRYLYGIAVSHGLPPSPIMYGFDFENGEFIAKGDA